MSGPVTAEWGARVGTELRKTFTRYLQDGFFDRFLSGPRILDIGYKGYSDDAHPIFPHAVGIDLDYPGYDGRTLPFADESQDGVFASHTLEHISDYRNTIAEWFRVLRIGGHLVIAVPHQFLYERKLLPPSRWNGDHKRFYTAASLMAEVEETLDPLSYRVRLLEENDQDFDYAIPPDQHAGGCYEIVLVLQRVARPAYSDKVLNEHSEDRGSGRFLRVPGQSASEPVVAIETTPCLPERILVLKVDHRGDFIMGRPAMELLRREFPSSHLTLVCGPWNRVEADQLGLFDEVIEFSFFQEVASHVPHTSTEEERVALFAKEMIQRKFDLALDLRVDQDTRQLLTAVDADHRAGFGVADRFPFLDIALPFINPTVTGRAERRLITPDRFTTLVGRHEGFAIVNPGNLKRMALGDRLIYGPYADFEPGNWTIECIIEPLERDFDLTYDVCWNLGSNVIGAGSLPVRRGEQPKIMLHLDEALKEVEIRISVGASREVRPFRFLGCRATKQGSFPALHQQEMLVLLASLVAHRMRFPYQTLETTTRRLVP
ncbi:MAG: methyltransferase domain-containing protein [Dehalococcoidia bacterium]